MRLTTKTSRSLPEHTVDCWVAADVLARFPDAQLWAPTQVGSDNWDAAFVHGPHKCFILEDKATMPKSSGSREHQVRIEIGQLIQYLGMPGAPVYYVLPAPPWDATSTTATLDPAAPVPAASQCRTGLHCTHTGQPHGPFMNWTYVVDALALFKFILTHRSYVGTNFTIATKALETIPGAMTLDAFLQGVESCNAGGVPFPDAASARQGWREQADERLEQIRSLGRDELYWRFADEPGVVKGRSGIVAVAVPVREKTSKSTSRELTRRRS